MKTETHYKLALLICNRCFPSATVWHKREFVTGCVMPDVNPFSYLRGFRIRPFFGHDWQNAKSFILSAVEKLSKGRLGYYGFGVLIHYLCDAFTHAHNSRFSGGLNQHSKYEKRLHGFVLQSGNRFEYQSVEEDLSDFILKTHERYEKNPASYISDASFITLAVEQAVAVFLKNQKLRPGVAALNELRCAERYTSRP